MSSNNPFDTDPKAKYHIEAALEAQSTHPDRSPTLLICPIGQVLMQEPVITNEGFVYDKELILKHLEQDKRDPQSRNPLAVKNLQPFPELLPFIQQFSLKQQNYIKIKEELIQNARAIAHHKPLIEKPDLFLCPISKEFIKNPVITAKGTIYDKESLKKYLIKTGNKDEKGQQLTIEDVVNFSAFEEQIKLFHFYLQRQIPSVTSTPSINTSGYSIFNFTYISSLFWQTNEIDESKSNGLH